MKNINSKRLALIGALLAPMLARGQEVEVTEPPAPVVAAEAPAAQVVAPAETAAEPIATLSAQTAATVAAPVVETAPTVAETPVSTTEAPAVQLTELIPAAPAADPAVTTPAPVEAPKSKDTLSVDFPDEDVRSILRNVADLFELNIVIPDTLQGRTSIKLRDVTWRQIFNVTLSPLDYTFVEEANIIKVISKGALDAEPFVTNSVILQNVAAATIDPVLRALLTTQQAGTTTTPQILGGSLVLNAQNNEYIVNDKPFVVQRIIETAKRLDIEPRQVVIETKFVEVSAKDNFELSLKLEGRRLVGQNTAGGLNTLGQTPVLPAATLLSGPPPSPATFNAVLSASDYTALLQALKTNGKTRLISNPTVVAVNGSKSLISVGREIQLVKKTENTGANNSGTSSLEKDGTVFEGVKIEVTPQITSKKLVSMAVKAEKTIASISPSGSSEQTFYDISKREATLNMILIDGQTAAIGGLLDKKSEKSTSKVPLLGDIPVLGNLFKSTRNSEDDTNLLIFITANILEPSKTSYRSVASPEQLFDLNLSERDIRGVSYEQSAEEVRLMKNAEALRKAKQDAAVERKILNESKHK